jgi:hypothetical protein
MSISSSITGNIYSGLAQTTPDAQTQAKADRKKARQAKRQRKAEGVMGAIGSFAESVAAGLEAEGLRRHKMGLSGAGFAAAFGAGASEIIDFGKLQKAKRKSAMIQKLGFAPADAEADAALIESLDALTTALGKQNQTVAPRPLPTDDADDPVPAAGATDPLAQQGPENEEDALKVLQSVAGLFGITPEKLMDTHPVLKDMQPITGGVTSASNPQARMMGLMEESPGVFVDSTGQVVDVEKGNP